MPSALPFFVTERLGEKRYKTPEGYLVIVDVPIARLGPMAYSPQEVSQPDNIIKPGPNGVVLVTRTEDELFKRETLASFEGKPLTLNHPHDMVTVDTHGVVSCGHMQHVRRGEGVNDDAMVVDFVVTSKPVIDMLDRKEIREVSNGYWAKYRQIGDGRAEQYNIFGNHCAFVPVGRCGPTCAVGDQQTMSGTQNNPAPGTGDQGTNVRADPAVRWPASQSPGLAGAFMRVFKDAHPADAEAIANALSHAPGTTRDAAPLDPIAALRAEMATIATAVKDLATVVQKGRVKTKDADEDETEEERRARLAREKKDGDDKGTKDHQLFGGSVSSNDWRNNLAVAEILSPGIRFGTFDAARPVKDAIEMVCDLHKRAIREYSKTTDGRAVIEAVAGPHYNMDKASCDVNATVFNAVAGIQRTVNDARGAAQNQGIGMADAHRAFANGTGQIKPFTVADQQKVLNEAWGKQA